MEKLSSTECGAGDQLLSTDEPNNPAKTESWHNLGRFLPSSTTDKNQHGSINQLKAAIERNSCMLEDLLATALEYDAESLERLANKHNISNAKSAIRTPASSYHNQHHRHLTPTLRYQIRAYVTQISTKYHNVGFHSFEHASHVMLSATKIVYMLQQNMHPLKQNSSHPQQHQQVSGTIYDPWLHFAISLSALLHDVDHKGLPNNVLHATSDVLSIKYGSEECMKSYAEWNSIDIGLTLLQTNDSYDEIARVIERGNGSRKNFYGMVKDLVLCTDIASKERRELGMLKWERACLHGYESEGTAKRSADIISGRRSSCSDGDGLKRNNRCSDGPVRRSSTSTVRTGNTSSESQQQHSDVSRDNVDGISANKTTPSSLQSILYTPVAAKAISEQIMQAADVSHTMQHFATFTKWNSHLYHEVLAAYQCDRVTDNMASHPTENWYHSQIGFFDHYIIPLAERLDSCGAFICGEDDHKFASFALMNKEQWIKEGEEFTRLMVMEAERMELLNPMPITPATAVEEEAILDSAPYSRGQMKHENSFDSSLNVKDEMDAEMAISELPEDDMLSVPGSVDTSSRVSFAASVASSRMSSIAAGSMAKWSHRSSSSDNDVDSSVDAIIPNILVQQVCNSLKADVQSLPTDMQANALRDSISRYQSNGSIQRHRGALLFVDISGFTDLSQNYPVEDFKTFINMYFSKIIHLVTSYGGEVVKFAGDALYAIWNSDVELVDGDSDHAINIERCTTCAITISATCNNYRVSKFYNTRRASDISLDSGISTSHNGNMYKLQDKNAEYKEREALLNIYCGVSEGVVAGIDVVAVNRAEFFLIGKPLKDVARAESLAGPGELVISPSVYDSLQNSALLSQKLEFTIIKDNFQRVRWPNHPTVNDMLKQFTSKSHKKKETNAHSLIAEITQSHLAPNNALGSDLMRLLAHHRHEAARDVVGKFTAELRRVVVIFISIMYEPSLPQDHNEDNQILEKFQSIYSIIAESISSRSGQVRQFINDDKGTVFIASFGLRHSVILHPSDTAVDAAKEAQKKLLDIMNIESSIGITLGKIFCGETGSCKRYEYSLLGPSVNLSARLMAKGKIRQISCDENLKKNTGRRHTFISNGTYNLKGYARPVPVFMPSNDPDKNSNGGLDDVTTYFMDRPEVLGLVDGILKRRRRKENKPRMILVEGDEGKGKNAVISAILKQPRLSKSSLILEANRCFHDNPFYCFIPIVTRLLLGFSETRERLVSLKRRYKHSSAFAPFLANDAFQSQAFPKGTRIVPDEFEPYLSLINDFVFKGFPLIKTSPEAKRLKDNEKAIKCAEVLSALILQYIDLKQESCIISINELDKVDSYSKKLLQKLLRSKASLLVIGGANDSSVLIDGDATMDNAAAAHRFLKDILGEESSTEVETMKLGLLDKEETFSLFQWLLRHECHLTDCDHPEILYKLYQTSSGMANAVARLTHTFSLQYHIDSQNGNFASHEDIFLDYLRKFLDDTPTSVEEIISFRVDQLRPAEQLLLKVASVASYDQYSCSQNLLETVLLALSRNNLPSTSENGDLQVPTSVGGDNLPANMETTELFQGDCFEQTLSTLVAQQFLDEVNVEMSDLSSLDSFIFRFRSKHEQQVINSFMLSDQKKRIHFEVADYYSSTLRRGGGDSLRGENESSSSSTMSTITTIPSTNWEVFHIIAMHYDLADVPIPAMLHYIESASSLSSLGVRDKAHGRLLSAYLMLEKVLRQASTLDVKVDEMGAQRQKIAADWVRIIGNAEVKDSMKHLTKQHLATVFECDIFSFTEALTMLIKFAQSVGNIEEEGYLFGSELYLQAILLLLLVLEDDSFSNLTTSISSSMGSVAHTNCNKQPSQGKRMSAASSISSKDSSFDEDSFEINDLTLSFQAFSGLLTFYRDAPIGANQMQETFLANLFVAVTHEANQMVHTLRTKCILSHLYLKHGDIEKALEECESIKEMYDHDKYSLELVTTYGMDWALICVCTMASTYFFRGQFAAARHNIDFLQEQMKKLDEFASSTKAMSKGNVSSIYILLHDFNNAAEIASGINATQYGYFFKPIGILQEELANREQSLTQNKFFDAITDRLARPDLDLLSILSADRVHDINDSRTMLNQSSETLCDRGIESVRAALCSAEVRNLKLHPNRNVDIVRKQIQYCQAGLVYLNQSLRQDGANNHERLKNHFMCLHQRAHFLCWHQQLFQLYESFEEKGPIDDVLEIRGSEIDSAKQALDECSKLDELYDYPSMKLLTGNAHVTLGLCIAKGKAMIQEALECIKPSDHAVVNAILSEDHAKQSSVGSFQSDRPEPPSMLRGMPSAA